MQTGYPWAWSVGICLVAAAIEGVCSGRNVKARFAQLSLPKFSLPLWAWSLVGFTYYAVHVVVLHALLASQGDDRSNQLMLLLVCLVLLGNAAWNFSFFRSRNLRATLGLTLIYTAGVLFLAVLLWQSNSGVALLYLLYVAYLPYMVWWVVSVWRRNRHSTGGYAS